MANKAFGWINNLDGVPYRPPQFRFNYGVIDPTGTVVVASAQSYVVVAYSDSPYDVWAKIVAQVRTDQSDSTLIVQNVPSSLDVLMFDKTY
jgi:hypothetical protein